MSLDLSIIIVTYNGREITLQTLAAYAKALSADPDHTYETIVVDNASQDGVADAVARAYPEIRVIRNQRNFGFAKANNIGYHTSRGRYILFSNPDVEVTVETLPLLIELMDRDPEVGACTPFLRLVRTGGIDWGAHRGFPTPWAALTYFARLDRLSKPWRRLSRVFGQYHLLDRDLTRPHEVDAIRGGFFFVRREVFERAGGWDEAYFMFGEDLDLCYQIKKQGYRVMFYPQAEALHYHGMTHGLKKHSQDLTAVDEAHKGKVYNAFYDAMRIFYNKNYRHQYGALTRWLVLVAIDLKKWLGVRHKTV
jgi:GT2 family glycosyltransferase